MVKLTAMKSTGGFGKGKIAQNVRGIASNAEGQRKKRRSGRIRWDTYIIRLFRAVGGDQAILKKHSCLVLSSMLDDLLCRIGSEASTLCKFRSQMTMKPNAINRGIQFVCGRSELTKFLLQAGTETVARYQRLQDKEDHNQ
ncbi:putative histone H2B [Gregarina niphandrodes]|uniref:Histone H2B n=1 Tax=Gregarina niphandrodes TaxID=110365 RepID=A0A023B6J6_GRENI|nr:putative histone H2B [Gregarina niphandrodes]EZG66565.1 putative histone H2B [Gregarina niphandrodes]|eukprot:XP_011130598.1 putative histone H2B [Gregarina niphandrodes]